MNQNVYLNGQSHKLKEEAFFVAHRHLDTSLMERLSVQLFFKIIANTICTLPSCQQIPFGGKDDISKPCINTSSNNANVYGYQQWLMRLIQNQLNFLKPLASKKKEYSDSFTKTVTQSSLGNFAQNVNG